MNILSINTVSNICSVSMSNTGKIKTLEQQSVKEHSEYLAPFVKQITEGKINNIDAIAVAIGPGSYAGIKVGVSFAKGLSLAIDKPIIPVNTFDAMNINIIYNEKYYTALYSHREYMYIQLFENNTKISNPNCLKFKELKPYKIFGYGLDKIEKCSYIETFPSSKDVLNVAIKNYDNLVEDNINKINPLYLSV